MRGPVCGTVRIGLCLLVASSLCACIAYAEDSQRQTQWNDLTAVFEDGLYNKIEYREMGILDCRKPKFGEKDPNTRSGKRKKPDNVDADWNIYTHLNDTLARVRDAVSRGGSAMDMQSLASVGDTPTSEEDVDIMKEIAKRKQSNIDVTVPYEADVELITYEKGGLSDATRRYVASIPSDAFVEEWRRSANLSAYSDAAGFDPVPRREANGDKLRVGIIFGEHGREIITTEVAMFLADTLADLTFASLAEVMGSHHDAERVMNALDRTVLHFIPVENKNGRRHVESGGGEAYCERQNGRFVDPNRNYPVHWGHKPPDYRPSEEFPGIAPLSEPETRLMFRWIYAVEPHAMLNIHSGMVSIARRARPHRRSKTSSQHAHLVSSPLLLSSPPTLTHAYFFFSSFVYVC